MESRVELFASIRRDARVHGLSIRALARRHRVARRTVRQALAAAEPPGRKPPKRRAPKLGPLKSVIDQMLLSDLDAPRKQRHTAQRVFDRLVDEHQAVISYSTVRQYVKARRAEIAVESGNAPVEAFIPQEHAPGAEAEVDLGDVWVELDGVRTRCYMFAFRLSSSGKSVHRVYLTCAQEAFLEGHIEAFNAIGGVPTKHIRYDNLTSAVTKVVYGAGRQRVENERWVLFKSHFGFDAFYCEPGIKGAHEKGGIEGEVGRFRRNFLTPVPVVKTLAELNGKLRIWDDFAVEQPLLSPLPAEAFDPGLMLTPRVDRSSLVTVRSMKYSVPARFINRKVRVSLQATQVKIFDGRTLIATHPRTVGRGKQCVQLDHYLEVLRIKPGALPGSTALAQARESGVFTPAHDAFWAAARKTDGDTQAVLELIDVLLLHRVMDAEHVVAGITAALTAVSADVVAVEARRVAAERGTPGWVRPDCDSGANTAVIEHRVVSLTQRRLADPAAVIAGLPPDKRPVPTVAGYDQLLAKRTTHATDPGPATTSKEQIS